MKAPRPKGRGVDRRELVALVRRIPEGDLDRVDGKILLATSRVGDHHFRLGRKDERERSQRQNPGTSGTRTALHGVADLPALLHQHLGIAIVVLRRWIGPNHRLIGRHRCPPPYALSSR